MRGCRGCLVSLVGTISLVTVVLWLTLPFLASWALIGLMDINGFNGTNTQVEVRANPPLLLLAGHADTVHIVSNNVTAGPLEAKRVDLRLENVALITRQAGNVTGELDGVTITAPGTPGQPAITAVLEKVTVSGPGNATQATITMTGDEAAQLAESELKAKTGVTATITFKAPNLVVLKLGTATQDGHLVIRNGDLVLVPSLTLIPAITLLHPGSGEPFRFATMTMDQQATLLTFTGTIDIQSLL